MYIHINVICANLGREKSLALPVFHSFTGCDTTPAFFGRGKKSAWEAWACYPEVTDAFTYVACNPFTITWKLIMNIFSKWNALQLSYMTRPVTSSMWIKQGWNCIVKRGKVWRQYHQRKERYCNTLSEWYTRLEYGAAVICLNSMHPLRRAGGGKMVTPSPGSLYGRSCLWPLKLAVS